MGKPEGAVEDYFIRRTEEYGCMCMKFTSPSKTGMPDRIIVGHGKTVFVELKAPGEKPRPRQIVVIKELRDHGALVYVTDSKPGVDASSGSSFPGRTWDARRGPASPTRRARRPCSSICSSRADGVGFDIPHN